MRPQAKAPFLLIAVVAILSYAVVTAAQWVYPVKATPTPELGDRWRQWADAIRAKAKDAPATTASGGTGIPTGGTRVPILPPSTNP